MSAELQPTAGGYWFWVLPEFAHRPRMRDVAALVAERHGLSLAELKGPSATRRIAWPRQEAYALIRKHCPNISYPQIGQFFGGRDHTTVIYGVRAHEARVAGAAGGGRRR